MTQKQTIQPPRPLTVLRLKKLWPHARKRGHEIGHIWRVGYYSKRDGLQCVWLVDKDGQYNWTADPEWIAQMFEVIQASTEKSFYGLHRPPLGPLKYTRESAGTPTHSARASSRPTKPKTGISLQNRSPYGWWIGAYIERFEFNDEDRANLNRRCRAYENTVLLRAKNREEAYRKLVELGSLPGAEFVSNSSGRRGFWRFEGVSLLLPVYEKIEDGAELLWTERRGTVKTIRSRVCQKAELPVFNDHD